MTEIGIGLRVYRTADEVRAAKPWLIPESITQIDGYWVGTDASDGMTGAVGVLPKEEAIIGVLNGQAVHAPGWGSGTGLDNFAQTKQGENYDGSSPVSASLFGGGLIPLPGFGALGSGRNGWLLWALLIGGAVLLLSKGKGRSAFAR